MSERARIVDGICRRLTDHYVFPDVAELLAAHVRARFAEGAYEGLDDRALAESMTVDLQSVNGDKHLRLRFHEQPITLEVGRGDAAMMAEAHAANGGIARAERLDGNIGYLDTRGFHAAEYVGDLYAAAMTLLAGTEALLIDVRRNPGGSPSAVAFFCGYLFDEPTHLNDIRPRVGQTENFWTPSFVPGRRFGGRKPVWVLTGPRSFSGAEDLAYSLQQQGRATVVGERTAGGANPCERFRVGEHLELTVSMACAVNPVSGTNWEGTGVVPDIATPAEAAFDRAYALALEHVLSAGPDAACGPLANEARDALAAVVG